MRRRMGGLERELAAVGGQEATRHADLPYEEPETLSSIFVADFSGLSPR